MSVERKKDIYTNLCVLTVAPAVFALGAWLYIESLMLIWSSVDQSRQLITTILFGIGAIGFSLTACLFVTAFIIDALVTRWGPK